MKPKIINFGSMNIDYVYSVGHIPGPGETVAAVSNHNFAGGKGLNQSIALARASAGGIEVVHAGMVGTDGGFLVDMLRTEGVDVSDIEISPIRTGHAIIQVDKSGQNCITVCGGANRTLTVEYVDSVYARRPDASMALVQNETNLAPYILKKAAIHGMKTVLNPSPMDDGVDEELLGLASIVIINEHEGAQITCRDDPDEILRYMAANYPKAVTVLTLGERGSWLQYSGVRFFQEAYKVPVVDTTAAGDTFTGYLLAGILLGESYTDAMNAAARAAALAVAAKGAAASIPRVEKLN